MQDDALSPFCSDGILKTNSMILTEVPMKQTVPIFYPSFQCTASACSDNCCIGWEIDIDPRTYDYYRSVTSSFAKELNENISPETPPHFLLGKDDRCPFLNQENLCEIFIQLGEEHLCEICTQHPRFHEWFGDYKESGLGLCCEEAVRLLLSDPEPLSFLTMTTEEQPDDADFDADLLAFLLSFREQLFGALQNRTQPLAKRLKQVLLLSAQAQEKIDAGELMGEVSDKDISIEDGLPEEVFAILMETLDFLQTLDPIDEGWIKRLCELSENLFDILSLKENFYRLLSGRLYELEHLCVYFLYRYLLKAVWDGDLLSHVKFSVFSTLMIFLLGMQTFSQKGGFSLQDQIYNTKAYSKEIEYSDENLEAVLEQTWVSSAFSLPSLFGLIDFLL